MDDALPQQGGVMCKWYPRYNLGHNTNYYILFKNHAMGHQKC